ncbi:RNA polymerase sigma factor [Candidatus Amarolinea aalborgensis]|jgi:RNA polymerase sigma-70 factor (ECF subfamily)|uniref:RNA polymerase sigma factor n=1 Tax=Candidatus Amarolinea aalborgensis TaxID=2249329 RepID=UPI003BFA03CD
MTVDLATGLLTNQEWVQSLREQRTDSYEMLWRYLYKVTYNLCTRRLADLPAERQLALAEECAQEALVQVWRKLDTYRGEGAFLAWVTRIAVNKLRDRLRHERPWQTKTEITENLHPTVSNVMPDVGALLRQGMQKLTPSERSVLTGRLFHERSSEEIAAALGISRGNERIIYLRARQKIKAFFAANGYTPAARQDHSDNDASGS